MDIFLRLSLFVIFLQAEIQLGHSNLQSFSQAESRCFPYDFNSNTESREFDRLLVIPRLATHSMRDLSYLEIIPVNNMRYNEFLSCVWKDRGLQNPNGIIDFDAVENTLANAIGRDIGYSGSGITSSRSAASRIVGGCRNLGGLTHGHKVALVRNCLLNQFKNSARY